MNKYRHTKLQKSTQRVYLLYGGGAPWEILVVKLIFWYYVRQFALELYLWIFIPPWENLVVGYPFDTIFSKVTLCVNTIYTKFQMKHIKLFFQGERGTMRNSCGEIDNFVQCKSLVLNLHLYGCLPPGEILVVGCPFFTLLHDIMYQSIKSIWISLLIKFSEKTTWFYDKSIVNILLIWINIKTRKSLMHPILNMNA